MGVWDTCAELRNQRGSEKDIDESATIGDSMISLAQPRACELGRRMGASAFPKQPIVAGFRAVTFVTGVMIGFPPRRCNAIQ
jgi:hypothetical protein